MDAFVISSLPSRLRETLRTEGPLAPRDSLRFFATTDPFNIRGIGLFDSGGDDDLTKGYRTEDIENVVLAQYNGVPVQVQVVAQVSVGNVPRLGIAGKDHEDDVVLAIVVMNRTMHTNDVLPRVKAEVERINTDGSLPPGVRLVPYYDRASLVEVTTNTVLHNLIFGCLLVFLIQWIFLGDLRSAVIVATNIPFALLFAVIMLVLTNQDANLLSVGAVDFGIIVDSAVTLVELSQHGRPDDGSDASPFSNIELFVPLKPFDQWPAGSTKDKLVEQLNQEFSDEVPGATYNFSRYIEDNLEEALSGVKGANAVKVVWRNLAVQ
jgi:Cu/Ag efflux pump CusA